MGDDVCRLWGLLTSGTWELRHVWRNMMTMMIQCYSISQMVVITCYFCVFRDTLGDFDRTSSFGI